MSKPTIIVTGGLGFIGSHLVNYLNLYFDEIYDILIVDNLDSNIDKIKNCNTINFYIHKDNFFKYLYNLKNTNNIESIIHLGACSNTMEQNRNYLYRNNFEYSKTLLDFCINKKIKFIYASSASVYGNSASFCEMDKLQNPINWYAESKMLFDKYIMSYLDVFCSKIIGLRFFNVYGINEFHKGKMASVPFQLVTKKLTSLFENGEQQRDFIYINDVVQSIVNAIQINDLSGIFNIGSGISRTFNDIVNILKLDVTYIKIPENIKNNYQLYTLANIRKARLCGVLPDKITTLEEGLFDMITKKIEI
jgi:ADP-L-glycero-D-manno-heptose 6-epimerase